MKITYTKTIYINNNSTFFKNFNKSFPEEKSVTNEELNYYFVNDYYDLTDEYTFDITIDRVVRFVGMNENGTIFDFKDNKKGKFAINYDTNCLNFGCDFIFENITFLNFNNLGEKKLSLFQVVSDEMNFGLTFQNCIFKNNKCILIKYMKEHDCNTEISSDKYSQVTVHNCQF